MPTSIISRYTLSLSRSAGSEMCLFSYLWVPWVHLWVGVNRHIHLLVYIHCRILRPFFRWMCVVLYCLNWLFRYGVCFSEKLPVSIAPSIRADANDFWKQWHPQWINTHAQIVIIFHVKVICMFYGTEGSCSCVYVWFCLWRVYAKFLIYLDWANSPNTNIFRCRWNTATWFCILNSCFI